MKELYIEGIDLTGKSTAVRRISERFNIPSRHRLLSEINPLIDTARREQLEHGVGSLAASHAYLDAIEYDINHHRSTSANNVLLQESTMIAKSYVIDKASGADISIMRRYDALLEKHPKFTSSVMLTASTECRLQRLQKRFTESPDKVTRNDLRLLQDPEYVTRVESIMRDLARTAFNACIIDTTHMTQDEVKEEIVNVFNLGEENK